jgi:hypothetical protein
MHRNGKGGGPIRGFVVSLLAIGLWLVVIAAVAWMVHSTPDSNRSIRRFRRARRSLAPQGRRHRAASSNSSASETSTVVVVETRRRNRVNRVIDLRERDPEPRPARWPADGWSLGSVAATGPRLAWATSGAPASLRRDAPGEVTRPSHRDVAHPSRPERPEVARTSRPGTARTPSRPTTPSTPAARTQSRTTPASPRVAGSPRTTPARQAAPVSKPRPAPRPGPRPRTPEPVRRFNFDERPHHAAVGQAQRPAAAARGTALGPARWRVIDLTSSEPRQHSIPAPAPGRGTGGHRETEARRWGLAAGAESQGDPGSLPEVFRLDPLYRTNEAGSRTR